MLYFHSWSGGKDSTASIILDHIHGLPPSKIIFSEVMFDRKREISGELPEHIGFIRSKAKPLFESWGYEVEIVRAEKDYLDLFYHVTQKSKIPERNGKYSGWLIGGKCAANRDLKVAPVRNYFRKLDLTGTDYTQYIGIAIDEPERLTAWKEPIEYPFLHISDLRNKWRMTFAKSMDCSHRYTILQGVVGVGFVPIRVMRN